ARTLGIDPADSMQAVEADIVDGPLLPSSDWAAVAALCKTSSANDRRQCDRLTAAAAASGATQVDIYLSIFLTGDLSARRSVITAPLARKHPDLAGRLSAEQKRLLALLDRRRGVTAPDRTAALLVMDERVMAG